MCKMLYKFPRKNDFLFCTFHVLLEQNGFHSSEWSIANEIYPATMILRKIDRIERTRPFTGKCFTQINDSIKSKDVFFGLKRIENKINVLFHHSILFIRLCNLLLSLILLVLISMLFVWVLLNFIQLVSACLSIGIYLITTLFRQKLQKVGILQIENPNHSSCLCD